MSGPILPPIPMLSSGGNGKVFLVIGILAAVVLIAKHNDPAQAAMAATVK